MTAQRQPTNLAEVAHAPLPPPSATPAQLALLDAAAQLREQAHALANQAGRLCRGKDPLRVWAQWLAYALRDGERYLRIAQAEGGELLCEHTEHPIIGSARLVYREPRAEAKVIDFTSERLRRAGEKT